MGGGGEGEESLRRGNAQSGKRKAESSNDSENHGSGVGNKRGGSVNKHGKEEASEKERATAITLPQGKRARTPKVA